MVTKKGPRKPTELEILQRSCRVHSRVKGIIASPGTMVGELPSLDATRYIAIRLASGCQAGGSNVVGYN